MNWNMPAFPQRGLWTLLFENIMTKIKKQILFYGDSNTYGYDPADPYENRYPQESCWGSILSRAFCDEWDIHCCGMNGRRLPDLRYDKERLDCLLSRLDPGDLFAMMLGTNDMRRYRIHV